MSGPAVYQIEHLSRYRYSSPARHCALALCLKPRDDAHQRLLSFQVVTDPQAPQNSEIDFFGNTKQVINIHREHQLLEISALSSVELDASSPVPDSLGAGAWEVIRSWKDLFGYWDLTRPSAFSRPSSVLAAFVDELGIQACEDPLQSLVRLRDTLHHSFRYVPGSTTVVSPIEHILQSRQGVCQDYSHVMISIARSWHIPSRYVGLPVRGQPGRRRHYASGLPRLGRMPAARPWLGRLRSHQPLPGRRKARQSRCWARLPGRGPGSGSLPGRRRHAARGGSPGSCRPPLIGGRADFSPLSPPQVLYRFVLCCLGHCVSQSD